MAITCFIQNKDFTSTLKDNTPYETWYCVKLDLNNFKLGICTYSYKICHKLEMKLHECMSCKYILSYNIHH